MNPLDLLFGQVSNAIQQHASPNTPGPSYDAGGILGTLSGLFGQTAQQHNMPWGGDQSQGYGGQGYGTQDNPAPASQDPFGDPADQGSSGFQQTGYNQNNPAPASQDPFGDPADQR